MDKIFSGADRARELGYKTYREFIENLSQRNGIKWGGEIDSSDKNALTAFITSGRWAATCECGESYYVEPEDPIGYCYGGCGNLLLDGKARRVIFPPDDERYQIENELLRREIEGVPTIIAKLGTQAALATNIVRPKVLPRNWNGQTVEELQKEHESVAEILQEIEKQKESFGLVDEFPALPQIDDRVAQAKILLEEIKNQRDLLQKERERLEKMRKSVEAGNG